MSDIELKYITTPAGNVAAHETVVKLAESLRDLSESNFAEHEDLRHKMEIVNGMLDQLAQVSEQLAEVIENQSSAEKKIEKILRQIKNVSEKLDRRK